MTGRFYVPEAVRSIYFSAARRQRALELRIALEPFGEASDAHRERSGWLVI
jgi:hypothetical protein